MFIAGRRGQSLECVVSARFDPAAAHVYRSPNMPTLKAAKEALPDFETAMRDLEELVERLEQGDLSLEESLASLGVE